MSAPYHSRVSVDLDLVMFRFVICLLSTVVGPFEVIAFCLLASKEKVDATVLHCCFRVRLATGFHVFVRRGKREKREEVMLARGQPSYTSSSKEVVVSPSKQAQIEDGVNNPVARVFVQSLVLL